MRTRGSASSWYWKGAEVKWPVTSDRPLIMAAMPSGWLIETVRVSRRPCWPGPKACSAAIWRVTAWIETFTAGSAMRSFSVKSLMVFTSGLMVVSQIGIELMAATPLTLRFARVRDQIVKSGPTPPEAKSRLPEISASFMGEPALSCSHSVLTSTPSFWACSSRSFLSSMIVSGR